MMMIIIIQHFQIFEAFLAAARPHTVRARARPPPPASHPLVLRCAVLRCAVRRFSFEPSGLTHQHISGGSVCSPEI